MTVQVRARTVFAGTLVALTAMGGCGGSGGASSLHDGSLDASAPGDAHPGDGAWPSDAGSVSDATVAGDAGGGAPDAALDGGTPGDGSAADGGAMDGAAVDAGTPDGDTADAGPGDAAVADAGASDAGSADGGLRDGAAGDGASDDGGSEGGAPLDAGSPDGASLDGAAPDADAADATPPDGAPGTGIDTPCGLGPGNGLLAFHFDRSTSPRIDTWNATCRYSIASGSVCHVITVGRVSTVMGGKAVLLDGTDVIRARFEVTGLQFTGATLYVKARSYDTRRSTYFQVWSPLYGGLEAGPVDNDFVYDWYAVDWSDHLKPTDRPLLTAFEISAGSGSRKLAVEAVELCVR